MRNAVRAIIIKDDKLLVMKRNKFGKHYYTLIGGGVDAGETIEEALLREVFEETSVVIGRYQPVFIEDAGDMYGMQHVYYCEYIEGEPQLHENSEEARISEMGQNTYQPVWLPLAELGQVPFVSGSLKTALLTALKEGWPTEPKTLTWHEDRL